ncbi:MAG: hypothetical protein M3312_01865 [Actinomycetota bacterium]|nr:hypothetical protein [Actinomycetota bacterium]
MSRLFLTCVICERKQADGLLSRAYWAHFELGDGRTLRVCPGCKQAHPDWEQRARAAANGESREGKAGAR